MTPESFRSPMPNLYAQLHRRFGKPDGLIAPRDDAALARRHGGPAAQRAAVGRRVRPGAAGRVVVIGAGFSGLVAAVRAGPRPATTSPSSRRATASAAASSASSDLVPGKNVEGGGELIGTNHPRWIRIRRAVQAHAPRGHRGRRRGADRARRQAADGGRGRERCGKSWKRPSPGSTPTGKVTNPLEPWRDDQRRGARQAIDRRVDRRPRRVAARASSACTR